MLQEIYRGYKIWSNPSGKTFYLAGPDARVLQWFKSIENTRKHADYLINVKEKFSLLSACQ